MWLFILTQLVLWISSLTGKPRRKCRPFLLVLVKCKVFCQPRSVTETLRDQQTLWHFSETARLLAEWDLNLMALIVLWLGHRGTCAVIFNHTLWKENNSSCVALAHRKHDVTQIWLISFSRADNQAWKTFEQFPGHLLDSMSIDSRWSSCCKGKGPRLYLNPKANLCCLQIPSFFPSSPKSSLERGSGSAHSCGWQRWGRSSCSGSASPRAPGQDSSPCPPRLSHCHCLLRMASSQAASESWQG